MKKLTKLTALALALALVLGMTAFAGTPSEIVYTDDFDETTTTDWKAGGSAISVAGNTYFKNGATFTETLTPGTRFYSEISEGTNGHEMTVVNGKGGIQRADSTIGFYLTGNARQIAYTFPTEWTVDEKDYALVAQIGWDMLYANGTGRGVYGHVDSALAGIMLTTKNASGTETSLIDGTMGYWNADATQQVNMNPNNQATHATGTYAIPDYKVGEGKAALLSTVIRPSKLDEEGTESLDVISFANRMTNYDSHYRNLSYDPITKVQGVWYTWQSYVRSRFEDYKVYKVSLDPADFTITSSKALTNMLVGDSAKITFSQPISISRERYANGTFEDVLPLITVTPAGGEALVYGEDYTISVAEKVSGTAVYDEMTITPVGEWAYGTTYTVGLPTGLLNIAFVAMADATPEDNATVDTVTFTTEAAPAVDMTLTAYKGLTAAGDALEALEDGTTYFAVTATKTAGSLTNGTIRLEILDADGNVVKYVANKKDLTSAVSFGVSFKVEEGYSARVSIDGGVLGGATID